MKKGITVYTNSSLLQSLIMFGITDIPLSQNGTEYAAIFGKPGFPGVELRNQIPAPIAMTITNLFASVDVAPGIADSLTVTVRKNGVDTAVTCTIAGAVATSASDTTHSATFAQGDLISLGLVESATQAASKLKASGVTSS